MAIDGLTGLNFCQVLERISPRCAGPGKEQNRRKKSPVRRTRSRRMSHHKKGKKNASTNRKDFSSSPFFVFFCALLSCSLLLFPKKHSEKGGSVTEGNDALIRVFTLHIDRGRHSYYTEKHTGGAFFSFDTHKRARMSRHMASHGCLTRRRL